MLLDTGLWTLEDFASFSGLRKERLQDLEMDFMELVNFKLHVSDKQYKRVLEMIEGEIELL